MNQRLSYISSVNENTELKISGYKDSRISNVFGENVFTETVMRNYLTDDAFKSLMNSIKNGEKNRSQNG